MKAITSVQRSDAETFDFSKICSSLFIYACGFEHRSMHLLKNFHKWKCDNVCAIRYASEPSNSLASKTTRFFTSKFEREKVIEVNFNPKYCDEFEGILRASLSNSGVAVMDRIVVDISGMSQLLLLMTLRIVRQVFPCSDVRVAYVSGTEYYPPTSQLRKLLNVKEEAADIGDFLDLDNAASEVVFPNLFAGSFHRVDWSCLFICCGYELNRSLAAYESVHPSKLVLLFSEGEVLEADIRLAYSKRIHEYVGSDITRSQEKFPNTNIAAQLSVLREYYEYLSDEHDIVVAPVHSKMQALAVLLFVEEFPDVQVIFPIPPAYLPSRGAKGLGSVYTIDLQSTPVGRAFASK